MLATSKEAVQFTKQGFKMRRMTWQAIYAGPYRLHADKLEGVHVGRPQTEESLRTNARTQMGALLTGYLQGDCSYRRAEEEEEEE